MSVYVEEKSQVRVGCCTNSLSSFPRASSGGSTALTTGEFRLDPRLRRSGLTSAMNVDGQQKSASDQIAERTNVGEVFQISDVIQSLRCTACIHCLQGAFGKFIPQLGFGHRIFGAALRVLRFARQ